MNLPPRACLFGIPCRGAIPRAEFPSPHSRIPCSLDSLVRRVVTDCCRHPATSRRQHHIASLPEGSPRCLEEDREAPDSRSPGWSTPVAASTGPFRALSPLAPAAKPLRPASDLRYRSPKSTSERYAPVRPDAGWRELETSDTARRSCVFALRLPNLRRGTSQFRVRTAFYPDRLDDRSGLGSRSLECLPESNRNSRA